MELLKPEFEKELKAKVVGLAKIEHNIKEAKDYALKLKDYYSKLIFTDDQIKDAEKERAKINKIALKIAEYRKDIVKEFKKPIDEFETVAKEAEKIIKETSATVDVQVKAFEVAEWDKKKQQIEKLYTAPEGFTLIWDEKWKNKGETLEKIADAIEIQLNEFYKKQETINKEIEVIRKMTDNELYIERYKHTGDLLSIINDIEKDKVNAIPSISEGHITDIKKTVHAHLDKMANIYSYTFYSDKESDIEALKNYAKNVLWMEVN
jgi:transcriptional regulator of met regulon